MRRGVWLLGLGVLAAALGAVPARADGTTTTATTMTTAPPTYAPLAASRLRASCVGAGVAAIAAPGRPTLTLGTRSSRLGPSAYPAGPTVVAFDSSALSGSRCAHTHVAVTSLSLFGGFVTAADVEATHGRGVVSGLSIDGSPVTLAAGQSALLGFWGQLTLGGAVGRLNAPLTVLLLKRHWSLPAGTTIFVAFAASPQPVAAPTTTTAPSGTQPAGTTTQAQAGPTPKKHRQRRHRVAKPLKRTPPLGFRPTHYVFPVDDGASYVDTYGANRNDIYDGWHHGDDLFSPLGTPVVAVANGTLSLVGWNRLGGWRLWLTDGDGNSFYYAHLAGYSRWVLDHPHVRAGEVVGFLGRTGDAFTTEPHLHFEIHPHQYLKLGYDGAVDPTAYLQKWRIVRVPAKEIPRPATLKAPKGTPTQEAAVVWHELLAARHLLSARPPGSAAGVSHPFPPPRVVEASGLALPHAAYLARTGAVSAPASMTPWVGGGVSGAAVVVALSAGAFVLRRRRRALSESAG